MGKQFEADGEIMRQNKNRMPILIVIDGHPVVCGLGLDLLDQLIVSLDSRAIGNWGGNSNGLVDPID